MFIKLIPFTVLAIFVRRMVLALYLRSRNRRRYAKVGRFSREEIPS